MNAVSFPKMLSNNRTIIIKDKEATKQNLQSLILSVKNTLFGDPYYGVDLRRLVFDHNNVILRDLVIDEIFSAITQFMPQLRVQRKDISVESVRSSVYINVKAQNMLDYNFDNYSINMINIEEL